MCLRLVSALHKQSSCGREPKLGLMHREEAGQPNPELASPCGYRPNGYHCIQSQPGSSGGTLGEGGICLFSWHRSKGFHVELHGPIQRIGSGGEGPLPPPLRSSPGMPFQPATPRPTNSAATHPALVPLGTPFWRHISVGSKPFPPLLYVHYSMFATSA